MTTITRHLASARRVIGLLADPGESRLRRRNADGVDSAGWRNPPRRSGLRAHYRWRAQCGRSQHIPR